MKQLIMQPKNEGSDQMSKTVKINVWLYDYQREEFMSIHKKILEKYNVIILSTFSEVEKNTEKYGDELLEKYGSMYDYETVDPGDIFENISYEKYEYYQMEKLMEYNIKLSILSVAYQIFEQQLRKFIYQELNQSLSPVRTEEFSKVGTNMGEIKDLYNIAGCNLESYEYWNHINILSDIVNTFKHGKGRSSKRLYNSSPNLFLKSYFSKENLMDQELTSNAAIVLDIEEINIEHYISVIINFWNQFPEHTLGNYVFKE